VLSTQHAFQEAHTSYYRCFYLDRYSLGQALSFEAETDAEAQHVAMSMIAEASGRLDRFELWEGSRLAYRKSAAAASPPV
jgi:hypothetical protein